MTTQETPDVLDLEQLCRELLTPSANLQEPLWLVQAQAQASQVRQRSEDESQNPTGRRHRKRVSIARAPSNRRRKTQAKLPKLAKPAVRETERASRQSKALERSRACLQTPSNDDTQTANVLCVLPEWLTDVDIVNAMKEALEDALMKHAAAEGSNAETRFRMFVIRTIILSWTRRAIETGMVKAPVTVDELTRFVFDALLHFNVVLV
jgi:hypothetical protein